jgi:hypothetical protein
MFEDVNFLGVFYNPKIPKLNTLENFMIYRKPILQRFSITRNAL